MKSLELNCSNVSDIQSLNQKNYDDNEKICVWNIHGLDQHKLRHDILGTFLSQHHIIMFNETWSPNNEASEYELPGYELINIPRSFKHKLALRSSGGICLFVRKVLYKTGIEFHKNFEDLIVWIKLKKEYFGFKKDVFIACVYIPPENSSQTTSDAFGLLLDEITSLPKDSEVII